MKKLLFLICALLAGVSGAWAQLTSISDGGCYTIQMARTDQNFKLGVTSELKHADQYLPVVAGVFQFSNAGDDMYYIKECSSGKYVYANRTTNSTGTGDVAIALGSTTLPVSTTSETKSENLNYYKWSINYVGTKGTYATDAWTIVPKEGTSTQWAVYGQSGENNVAFYNRDDGDGYYKWGFVQILKPTILSSVLAKLTLKQIKDLGYTVDQITSGCRPSTLDAPGWPSTTTYNTFKSSVEALADGDLVFTPFNTMWNARIMPAVGHFYRLKGDVSNKYLKGSASSTANHTTQWLNSVNQEGALSVFYYDSDETMIAYSTGRVFSDTHTIANVGATGNKFTFETPRATFVASRMYGSLSVKSDAAGVGQYLYSYTDAKDYVDRNGGKAYETNWSIEEVTSLPVTISTADYATLYAPVALEVPAEVTAYTATDQGTYLSLTAIAEVAGKTIIPANTGVILYKDVDEATTVYFNISTGGSASSALTGTTAAISRPLGSYILATGSEGVGFYQDGASTIPGFKAYLAGAGVKGFLGFNFDETVIQETKAEKKAFKGIVYDLSGNPVPNPKRGIYVMDGETIFIP